MWRLKPKSPLDKRVTQQLTSKTIWFYLISFGSSFLSLLSFSLLFIIREVLGQSMPMYEGCCMERISAQSLRDSPIPFFSSILLQGLFSPFPSFLTGWNCPSLVFFFSPFLAVKGRVLYLVAGFWGFFLVGWFYGVYFDLVLELLRFHHKPRC